MRESVDVNAIAREAIERAALDTAPRIELRTAFFEPLPPIEGSREQLVRAFRNLLAHARAAVEGRADAAIDVETEPDGALVAVRIFDNGPGLSEDRIERIFAPPAFEGDADAAKALDEFGLAVACEILQRHRGTLTVRSRPGEGTCFVALVPTPRG